MHQEQSAAGRASKYDSYALDKMSIRVSPKVFGARIRCVAVRCRLQGFTIGLPQPQGCLLSLRKLAQRLTQWRL